MDKYNDIINLPHYTSPKRPRMSMLDRAAQFSPFAALTGYDAAVKETARLTEERVELDEYEKGALDMQLQIIREHLKEHPEVTIMYFQPDTRKAGGAYLSLNGRVKKIDDYEKCVILTDQQKIPIEDIVSLDGKIFKSIQNTII
ncbi:MAG: hypothetical protein Q4B74_01420 [Eubacteriales bacterium]|nr:hypothetical protein [Eubacteriales bacterium]